MQIDMLTREYPPEVYGGAGVHVGELVGALRGRVDVRVRCFGADRAEANTLAYAVPSSLQHANPAIGTLGVDLAMAADISGVDLVHSHTWYASLAGFLAKQLHGVPHVVTAHSLEPLRPWKAEQLGGGYRVSSWAERTAMLDADAVIAVSHGMRRDILRVYPDMDPGRVHVVHNGIDPEAWAPGANPAFLARHGIAADRPLIVFVGRITRQKGLPYLLKAARALPADVQLVVCAGAPDTPEILAEVRAAVDALQRSRSGVVWIEDHLPRPDLIALLTAATVFVCPSVYEPLGIVNLEAMACSTAVVGTATGGIPEVVDDGVTGLLVPIDQEQDGTGTPRDPDCFVADLTAALSDLATDPARARRYGEAGRSRVVSDFTWGAVAGRTLDVYRAVLPA